MRLRCSAYCIHRHRRTACEVCDKLLIPKDVTTIAFGSGSINSTNTSYTDCTPTKDAAARETVCSAVDVLNGEGAVTWVRSCIEKGGLEFCDIDLSTVVVVEGGEGIEEFLLGGEADEEVGELVEILWEGERLWVVGREELR